MFLEHINSPADVKKLNSFELQELAKEMRQALITKISQCGGHLASNLGVVELTIALHYVFDSPDDKIVFDVSHQSYCHKMLTGRNRSFLYPECYNDVSGYTNPAESEHDVFQIGHTSTSISLACGLAKARNMRGGKENIVAVIGDSSLDGGEAFEGLNFASELDRGIIVIVNDNDTSIDKNVGSLSHHLRELERLGNGAKENFFRTLGFEYSLVEKGHYIDRIIESLQKVKGMDRSVVVHVKTQKGKGYVPAEQDTESWHWARPFDIETGKCTRLGPTENYGNIAGEFLLQKIGRDPQVVMVAAATALCAGFNEKRRKKAGKQYVDVGIAEQHAISMIAGIAQNGGKPIFATHSTFYQRAYDQIEQELCINRCPATMIVTHASVLGHTNVTHVGLLDMALLGNIPGLTYLAPTNKEEYMAMLDWSIEQRQGPVAIRVPWHGVFHTSELVDTDYSQVQYRVTQRGNQVAILALGGFYQLGESVAALLEERTDIRPTLINPRFITGLDAETLASLEEGHDLVVTLEDGILSGGFGSKIAQFYGTSPIKVLCKGFGMDIPVSYSPAALMERDRLTKEQIVEDITGLLDR